MVNEENTHSFYFEILQGERVSQDNKKEAIKPPVTKDNLFITDTNRHGYAKMWATIPRASWYERIHECISSATPQQGSDERGRSPSID